MMNKELLAAFIAQTVVWICTVMHVGSMSDTFYLYFRNALLITTALELYMFVRVVSHDENTLVETIVNLFIILKRKKGYENLYQILLKSIESPIKSERLARKINCVSRCDNWYNFKNIESETLKDGSYLAVLRGINKESYLPEERYFLISVDYTSGVWKYKFPPNIPDLNYETIALQKLFL